MNHPAALDRLVSLLRAGACGPLVEEARRATKKFPGAPWAWHLLGLGHLNLGQAKEAVAPLRTAARLLPGDADILEHLGIALMQNRQPRDALAAFETCLKTDSRRIGVLINCASLANDTGRFDAAEKYARQVLAQQQIAEAYFQLGRSLRGRGCRSDAVGHFKRAFELARNSAVACNDIGLQCQGVGDMAQAETCVRHAIAIESNYPHAYSNLGLVLKAQGRVQDAFEAMQRAVAIDATLPEAHINLASLYNQQRMFPEAEKASRRAIELAPGLPAAHCCLGNALTEMQRYPEAEAAYRQALKQDAECDDARNNLGNLLQLVGRYAESEKYFRGVRDDRGYAFGKAFHAAAMECDWHRRARDAAELLERLKTEEIYIDPFAFLAMDVPDALAAQRRLAGLAAVHQVSQRILDQPPLVDPALRPVRDRLRIGYLSADIHDHATMHLLAGVLAAHDRSRFSIGLYSYGPDSDDHYRALALRHADIFRDLRTVSDEAAARQIMADGVDILVDLKGFTRDSRPGIQALRPAPLIISWLGYPGTLGHPRLADYIIGDAWVTPTGSEAGYSEKILSMPHSYQPNDRSRPVGAVPLRTEIGLPEEGFIFSSFNQSYKFNPETFDVWGRILDRVPQGHLWLLEPGKNARKHIERELLQRGVASARVHFAPRLPQAEHLERFQCADLALDTFPYGSHTTGSDALWVGVPMVTRLGDTFASRVPASLLAALGLPDLVAEDWAGYQDLATTLATDVKKYAEVKSRLAANRLTHPLFDTDRFVRDLERLYWDTWGGGDQRTP